MLRGWVPGRDPKGRRKGSFYSPGCAPSSSFSFFSEVLRFLSSVEGVHRGCQGGLQSCKYTCDLLELSFEKIFLFFSPLKHISKIPLGPLLLTAVNVSSLADAPSTFLCSLPTVSGSSAVLPTEERTHKKASFGFTHSENRPFDSSSASLVTALDGAGGKSWS